MFPFASMALHVATSPGQELTGHTAFDDIILAVADTLNIYIIPFLFVLATLIFIWGVIMYVSQADDDAARKKAKGLMMWGIIGLAIVLAVWGIVIVVVDYFGIGGVGIPFGPGELTN